MADDDIDFTGMILWQGDMAIKFRGRTWDINESVFLPRSQIAIVLRSEKEGYKPGEVTVTVPRWLAEKKEMI
jgi:hypothetical protein